MIIATNLRHQTSVRNGLQASLIIGRKTDKYEAAIVQHGMHKGHHERVEAVIGDISTYVAKLLQVFVGTS